MLCRGICAGVSLEIGDKGIHRAFFTDLFFLHQNLLRYAQAPVRGKIAASSGGAEDTAAISDFPVPVRAAAASVQCETVDLAAELPFHFIVQTVVRFIQPAHFISSVSRCRAAVYGSVNCLYTPLIIASAESLCKEQTFPRRGCHASG